MALFDGWFDLWHDYASDAPSQENDEWDPLPICLARLLQMMP